MYFGQRPFRMSALMVKLRFGMAGKVTEDLWRCRLRPDLLISRSERRRGLSSEDQ